MKTVFESSLAVDAHMVLHLLQNAGIDGQVFGDFLPGATGDLPAGQVRVLVADEDEAEARSVIAEWEKRQPAAETQVSAPRRRLATGAAFVAGAIAGSLVTWAVLRTPSSYDDFDGEFESSYTYRKDLATTSRHDYNLSGRPEWQCVYRFGVVTTCEFTDESTGRVRKRDHYSGSILRRTELDSDGDGTFDIERKYDLMGEVIGPLTLPLPDGGPVSPSPQQ